MRKHILLLVALQLCMALPALAQATFTEGNFNFTTLTDNTVEVSSCNQAGGIVTVPATVIHDGKEYTVTTIGMEAFRGDGYTATYSAISLPSTVTDIQDYAFLCCGATYIKMSPAVKHIGAAAFEGCFALGRLDLPDVLGDVDGSALAIRGAYTFGSSKLPSLKSIGAGAFANTSCIDEMVLPETVTYIGARAFAGSSLTSITLPSTITSLPFGLFQDCSKLTNVNPLEFTGRIEPMVFNGCSSLERMPVATDNPYVSLQYDGRVMLDRTSQEIVSLLPSVTELVVSYPATGIVTYSDSLTCDPFSDNLPALRSLELPHTWQASLSYMRADSLKDVVMRMATPVSMPSYFTTTTSPYSWTTSLAVNLHVFDYAKEAYRSELKLSNDQELLSIDRPTEQLYLAEVIPMCENDVVYTTDTIAYMMRSNWQEQLEDEYPEYYVEQDSISPSREARAAKDNYRRFMYREYMTESKTQDYFGRQPVDTVINCIDGSINISAAFDATEYTDWYLARTFVPANDVYSHKDYKTTTLIAPMTIDTDTLESNLRGQQYYVITYGLNATEVWYALNMLPGIPYDIYLLTAPYSTPEDTIYPQKKSKIRCQFGNAEGETRRTENVIELSNERCDTLLLFQDKMASTDYYNYLHLTSAATNSNVRGGYTHTMSLIGVRIVPKVDITPVGIPDAQAATDNTIVGIYDLCGRRIPALRQGVCIVRYSDGTTRKLRVR
ncbi:MAG: leucine-rich repeat domain-containing protein [Bacteroidaceae bacterium]|nr:leucine-rich repeat domain-containing protein [Bacteroidaceae bacterium]